MVRNIMGTVLVITALFSCNNKQELASESNDMPILVENEIKKITIYLSQFTTFVALRSNDIIEVLEEGEPGFFDVIELNDENDELFGNLQKVLRTARIDTTLPIGAEYVDTAYFKTAITHNAEGFIINYGSVVRTVLTTNPNYETLKNGWLKDVPINETVIKEEFSFDTIEYDIDAEHIILYQYNDSTINNDTICFSTHSNKVRLNSYVVEIDSALFKVVVDSIMYNYNF